VKQCLNLVNLQADVVAIKYPAELSGGMRKRVGIARAIAGQPKYLLYDEPTSGLDPVNADIIDSLVQRLAAEIGVTSVMVTHDVRGAFRVAHRLALLTAGRIVMQGTPQDFLASQHPQVKEFLERDFDRLNSAWTTVNRNPLGACAITTTGFPIDRDLTAELLGFEGLQTNSYGAIAAVDYVTEAVSAIAVCMINLGRLVQDLLQWCTAEFNFLRLTDSFVQMR